LKVAHHGSRYASTEAFVSAVSPRFAVISCSADNEYGHPGASTLTRLGQHNVTVFRTDVQGDVSVVSDGNALTWSTTKTASPEQLIRPGISDRRASE